MRLSMDTMLQYKVVVEENKTIKSNTCDLPYLETRVNIHFEYIDKTMSISSFVLTILLFFIM